MLWWFQTPSTAPGAVRWFLDSSLLVVERLFLFAQFSFFLALARVSLRVRRALGMRAPPPPPPPCPAAAEGIFSVVIPAYNEGACIGACLEELLRAAAAPRSIEVVVADGGCSDDTMAIVRRFAAAHTASGGGEGAGDGGGILIHAVRTTALRASDGGGRGPTVNAGLRAATGDVLMVLHADTKLPKGFDARARLALRDPTVTLAAFGFGTQRAPLRGGAGTAPPAGLALLDWSVNMRCRLFGFPFGDQALTTTRGTLSALGFAGGHYPADPILEEYQLVARVIARAGRVAMLGGPPALCSPRRWESMSVWYVCAVNQAIMLWFRCGATTAQVFEFYYGVPAPKKREEKSSEG